MEGCQRVRVRDKFVLVYEFLVQRRQQQKKKKDSTSYPKGTAKGKKGEKVKRTLVGKRALSVVWGADERSSSFYHTKQHTKQQ